MSTVVTKVDTLATSVVFSRSTALAAAAGTAGAAGAAGVDAGVRVHPPYLTIFSEVHTVSIPAPKSVLKHPVWRLSGHI